MGRILRQIQGVPLPLLSILDSIIYRAATGVTADDIGLIAGTGPTVFDTSLRARAAEV